MKSELGKIILTYFIILITSQTCTNLPYLETRLVSKGTIKKNSLKPSSLPTGFQKTFFTMKNEVNWINIPHCIPIERIFTQATPDNKHTKVIYNYAIKISSP